VKTACKKNIFLNASSCVLLLSVLSSWVHSRILIIDIFYVSDAAKALKVP